MRNQWIARVTFLLGVMSLLLIGLLVVFGGHPAAASEDIALAEGGMTCTVCHDKPGSKLYTDRGKYYEATGSLEGYDQVIEAFAQCTSCHVSKPGSEELTERGQRVSRFIDDMTELRDILMGAHPVADVEPPPTPPTGDDPTGGDGEPETSDEAAEGGGWQPMRSQDR